MADNTILNTGTGGDTISTDDLGTVKVQRVKVQYGADGLATDVASGTPLPVTNNSLGTDGGTLPTQAVQVAGTDGTNFQTVATNAAGNLQVGLSAAIPTGTNTIGKVDQGTGGASAWKVDGSAVTQPVSGTVTANAGTGTMAVSAAALPLPSGASTAAKQPALGTAGTASADVVTVQGIAGATAVKTDGSAVTQPVSGTVTANAGTGTMAVSAASLPLPSGAATLAKQPALGTAGVASADVLSVQGVASMTALKVDGSAVTQPVSGTVTANAGTGPFPVSDNSGSLTVDAPVGTPAFVRLSDGSAAITALPITDNGGSLTVDGTVTTNAAAVTTGGSTPATYVSAASTNATSVKASAGTLYGVTLSNVNAAARYLKVFNKASAPTVGTDTPVMNLIIPGNTAGSGSNVNLGDIGVAFGTGIAFAITTGAALLDTGAVAASELTVTLLYK